MDDLIPEQAKSSVELPPMDDKQHLTVAAQKVDKININIEELPFV